MLNEKSEENRRLMSKLLEKDGERRMREIEFQEQLASMEEEHQLAKASLEENEALFRNLYMQASNEHKEVAELLDEEVKENDLLSITVVRGNPKRRNHDVR